MSNVQSYFKRIFHWKKLDFPWTPEKKLIKQTLRTFFAVITIDSTKRNFLLMQLSNLFLQKVRPASGTLNVFSIPDAIARESTLSR